MRELAPFSLLITCEHAVNHIPIEYEKDFSDYHTLLTTHRGYDLGAQTIARRLSSELNLPYYEARVSRLLIDCNRTISHPRCFSEISRRFDKKKRLAIQATYYQPYWDQVLSHIQEKIEAHKTLLHLSIHSFTPILDGKQRQAEMGLLYHSKRKYEVSCAKQWQQTLQKKIPSYRVRRNYPYLGASNGLVQACRQKFAQNQYLGFEVEINQAISVSQTHQDKICQALSSLIQEQILCNRQKNNLLI